jgi:hypothetical protein
MLEIPGLEDSENTLSDIILGKRILKVAAAHAKHDFISSYNDPAAAPRRLVGKVVEGVYQHKEITYIRAEQTVLIFNSRVSLHYGYGTSNRNTHSLYIGFEEGAYLSAIISELGVMWCYTEGEISHPYFGANAPRI